MSLLTGAPLTAAEVARELGLTHANASYHLRNLLAAGMIAPAGEERIRGGMAKRYRYEAGHDLAQEKAHGPRSTAHHRALYTAVAGGLIRRVEQARFADGGKVMADAELWIEPELWKAAQEQIAAAARTLHDAAKPAGTPGTMRTSMSIAMFPMADR